MASKKKTSLKLTNPQKYYRKKRGWLGFAKFLSALLPPMTVLIVYAVQSAMGGMNTNPFNPWRFSFGMILMVVGIVAICISELRRVSKESRREGHGPDFRSTIVFLYLGTILWLFYLTMFYLIILCIAETVSTFLSSICSAEIAKCRELEDKEETAEINARANVRVQSEEKSKSKAESIE